MLCFSYSDTFGMVLESCSEMFLLAVKTPRFRCSSRILSIPKTWRSNYKKTGSLIQYCFGIFRLWEALLSIFIGSENSKGKQGRVGL